MTRRTGAGASPHAGADMQQKLSIYFRSLYLHLLRIMA